jgi:histidyl-tRNA synthetase
MVPPVSERFGRHEALGQQIFERAGYRRIITPMFEETKVFARGVGEGSDIVSKEMYTFRDRSDNELTLRPEGTAPVIRAIISHSLWNEGLPLKFWYSAAMFRYDRPQKGRYRQHHQLGIEAVGTEDPAVDAEVIEVGAELLARAGMTATVLLLNSIGHPGCRAEYLPRLQEFLRSHAAELDEDCNRRMETNPLRAFDCKIERDQQILADAPTIDQFLCAECRAHFEAVQGCLKDADVSYTLAPRLVRGLDYYTRTTFEFQTGVLEAAQSTVCAGGRYDGLAEILGGPRLPGIGFGSGIERVLLAQELAGNAPPGRGISAFIIPLGQVKESDVAQPLRRIRELGLSADMPYVERSLKTQLRHAARIGARFAILIGEREREKNVATVRDMDSGEQVEVALDDLPRWLKEKEEGRT